MVSWDPVGALAANDYYVVKVPHSQGEDWQWTRSTQVQLPAYLFDLGFANREYSWTVTVCHYDGNQPPEGPGKGAPVSPPSAAHTFTWTESTGPNGGLPPHPVP